MELGYINFSNEEKNNLYKVIQSIREHHAIDELGIGRIRDAFSNEMFPGMSTLQNRAKSFAVLPALYYKAEKGHYNNVREVRRRVLDLEIKLTRQLMNGAETSEERYGITELDDDFIETFDIIGKKRGALTRGGVADYEKVSNIIVQDLKNGYLGNVTFDRLEDE